MEQNCFQHSLSLSGSYNPWQKPLSSKAGITAWNSIEFHEILSCWFSSHRPQVALKVTRVFKTLSRSYTWQIYFKFFTCSSEIFHWPFKVSSSGCKVLSQLLKSLYFSYGKFISFYVIFHCYGCRYQQGSRILQQFFRFHRCWFAQNWSNEKCLQNKVF